MSTATLISRNLKDICYRLDHLVGYGNSFEKEVAAHLLHEIGDMVGRYEKRQSLTEGSQATQSATSTSTSTFQKTK